MQGPENTLPMMMGKGPFGNLEMGGMFTVLKVRDELAPGDFRDPGPYRIPPGTVARERLRATVTIQPGSTTPGSSDCTLQGGETGTGFLNDATLIVNGGNADATACAPTLRSSAPT